MQKPNKPPPPHKKKKKNSTDYWPTDLIVISNILINYKWKKNISRRDN